MVIGDGPVTLMGCVNLSRDSTYRESVATGPDDAVRMGRIQAAQGAAIIDLGAESSNASAARVSPDDQVKALVPVVERLAAEAVVSVETYEPAVVAACLDAGARILNMTGREHEDEMLALAAEYDAAVVMCFGETANVREASDVPPDADPMPVLLDHFGAADRAGAGAGRRQGGRRPGHGLLLRQPRRPADPRRGTRRGCWPRPSGCGRWACRCATCCRTPTTCSATSSARREGFYAVFAALGGTHLLRVHEVPHLRVVLDALRALEVR